jgi:hypothetical protein
VTKAFWDRAGIVAAFGTILLTTVSALPSIATQAGATGPPNNWTQLSPSTSPPPSELADIAYDPATSQLLLFGGESDATGPLGSTWSWTGTTWDQLSPTNSPSPRFGSDMAYDAATGQFVLFGGQGGDFIDTWTWNGSNWIELSPPTSPPLADGDLMAYDSATSQLILVLGGNDQGTGNETWSWNGTTWTDTNVGMEAIGGTMGYDPDTSQLIAQVGKNTFNWTGTTWVELRPATSPPQREEGVMAYDTALSALVLFGGEGARGALNDTWAWTGSTWTRLDPTTSPPAREDASMDYDTATGHLVLFGGLLLGSSLDDTWEYGSVPPASTTTAASVDPTSATHGESVTYGATVTAASGSPSGTVEFTIGSTKLCKAPLSAGTASCSATNAPRGTDTVTATYGGSPTFLTSSGTTTLDVS